MRRALYLSLAFLFVFAAFASMASAAQNVANPSQKGSLLVFPKIDVTAGRDTIVEINNDFYKAVNVKCYWMNSSQAWADFMFTITANQPVWFSARSGRGMTGTEAIEVQRFPTANGTFTTGELKCWAVNAPGELEISHNHLYGNATIFDYANGNSLDYNSWNFIARGVARGAAVGDGTGTIVLSGETNAYDACPKFLVTDFVAAGGQFDLDEAVEGPEVTGLSTQLTVAFCKEDLRQPHGPIVTKLHYNVWSEDEVKYSGAYQCAKCWFEGFLADDDALPIVDNLADIFTVQVLGSPKGRLQAIGMADTVICPTSQNVPLIGVVTNTFQSVANGSLFVSSRNTNGSGVDGTGTILWDPQRADDYPEAPGQ